MASAASRIAAVERARGRRASRAEESSRRTEWFINEVSDKINLTLLQRVKLATELVKSSVIKNISRPVTKSVVNRRIVISNRSKPGEYPKADTTQLMKTIFGITKRESSSVSDGFIGTILDYGVTLELKMNRSFLVRTLNEERSKVIRILTGPIR